MPPPLPDDQIAALIQLIQSRISSLTGPRPAPHDDDGEDALQDVLLAVLRRLPQFDPRRSSLRTFVVRVTDRVLIDRFRQRNADKRNPNRHPDSRSEKRSFDPFVGRETSPDLRELMLDLAEAIRQLPPDLEQLAQDLQQWTPTDIAQREGRHRGTIYRRIDRLRKRWEDSSLRDYIDP